MNSGGSNGSVVGRIWNSSVIISNVDIYVEMSNTSYYIGGVVGQILDADVEIKFITASGIFTNDSSIVPISSIFHYGGIIGNITSISNKHLTLSSITNNITITGSGTQLGGVIGFIGFSGTSRSLTVQMDDITNNGTISSNQNTFSELGYGGIIGLISVGDNTLVLGGSNITVTGPGTTIVNTGNKGHIIGKIQSGATVNLTGINVNRPDTLKLVGVDEASHTISKGTAEKIFINESITK
jgi:hypothetical protein